MIVSTPFGYCHGWRLHVVSTLLLAVVVIHASSSLLATSRPISPMVSYVSSPINIFKIVPAGFVPVVALLEF